MKNLLKEQRGITLLALAITIIILLILSGVSINLLIGENGLIAKTKDATEKTNNAIEKDFAKINNLEHEITNALVDIEQDDSSNGNQSKFIIGKEITDIINNPDRGFYKLVQVELQQEKENISYFEHIIGNIKEDNNDISIISFQLNLINYVSENVNISTDKINEINEYFSIMRDYGYKVIFRVVYDSQGVENPEPDFDTLINQIEMLAPVYENNEDILFVIEAGYLGEYGEWHSGKYDEDIEKRNLVISKLLEVVPESIQINLRRPSFIMDYIGTNETVTAKNAFSNEKIARLGLHNDGYLASETDYGTFPSNQREEMLNWQELQTKYTAFGGECLNKDSQYTNLENAIWDMQKRHCNYLNKTYDTEVKEKWKATMYNGIDEIYVGKNGYDYIQNHLGYRLVLEDSKFTSENKMLQAHLKIKNVGFGDIVKAKNIELLLVKSNVVYNIKTNLDIRMLKNENYYIIDTSEKLPENIESGEYKVYLQIEEPYENLQDKEEYQIKLSNEGIWDNNMLGNFVGLLEIS